MSGNTKTMTQDEEPILRIIIQEILNHWYLFVFFIMIFMGIAVLYLKYTAPTYKVGSKLMINTSRDNHTRNIRPEEFLEGFQLIQTTKEIENEMIVLQSLPLIEETIKELGFKVSYYYKENFVPYRFWPFYNYPTLILREMFGNVPFEVVPDENHTQPIDAYFYVKILNDKEYSINVSAKNIDIYDFKNDMVTDNIDRISFRTTAKFGDTIQGPNFSFRVLLNSSYNKEFDNKDLYFSFKNTYVLSRIYQNRLKVEQETLESSVLDITFSGGNVYKSAVFLDELVNNYIQRGLSKKNFIAEATIDYIDQELANIATSLNMAEGQLQNFKRRYQVMDIEQKNLQLSQYIQRLENQKNEILQNLRFYNELYKYFEENKDSPNMLAPSSMGVNDPVLNNMIQQLATYNAEKNTLEEKNLQRNPRYKTLTKQIEDLRNSISENIRFYIRSTQSRLDEINTNIERYKIQESQLPGTQTRLMGYERKFRLNNDIYNFLLQKRAEAQIAKASILPDSEVLESANFQGIASPKKLFVLAFALILAFLIPGIWLFLRFYFNNNVTSSAKIKDLSSIPVLASVLHNDFKTINLLIDYPSSPISESLRSLRTNLEYLFHNKERKAILITSSTEKEGKTFISFNLAVSLALLNNKVILLGFDLRKSGNFYKVFENPTDAGLGKYLSHDLPLEEFIQKTSIKNLDVILGGSSSPPNPAELIESKKTEELLSILKSQYDYIVIDTPPIGPVSDAFLLMKYTDINLFIVRQNYTNLKVLKYNLEDIEQKQIKNVYLILNDLKPHGKEYGYKYKYTYYSENKKAIWPFKVFKKSSSN